MPFTRLDPLPSASGDYWRPQPGRNQVHVLTDNIAGYLYWNTSNKPVRSAQMFAGLPADIQIDTSTGRPRRIQRFYAMVVWDYLDKAIKIWECTQQSLMSALEEAGDPEGLWKHPANGIMMIKREGQGIDTRYTCQIGPGQITPEIAAAFDAKPIDLTALYSGSNPFEAERHSHPLVAPVPGMTAGHSAVATPPTVATLQQDNVHPAWVTYVDMLARAATPEQCAEALNWAATKGVPIEQADPAYENAVKRFGTPVNLDQIPF